MERARCRSGKTQMRKTRVPEAMRAILETAVPQETLAELRASKAYLEWLDLGWPWAFNGGAVAETPHPQMQEAWV